jgi:hypothetical protein
MIMTAIAINKQVIRQLEATLRLLSFVQAQQKSYSIRKRHLAYLMSFTIET